MLGIPMLGMALAKTAIAKKIDKNARNEMKEAAPAILKGLGGMPRLKEVPKGSKGLNKLPEGVRNKMGFMRYADGSVPTEMSGPLPRFCGGTSKPYKK